MKPKGIDYSTVDWTKSNRELADELGVHIRTIYDARIRRGIPNNKKFAGRGNPNPTNQPWKHSSKIIPIDDPDYEFAFISKGDGRKKPCKSWNNAVLRKYGSVCMNCGYYKPPVQNHCHHIVSISDGGKNTVNNAIVLCSRCHDEVHAKLINLGD